MVRDYELMYIVRPDVDEDGLRVAVDSVKTLIESQGGEITKTTMWGKRRLAYEVKHLRDGHYVIVEARFDGSKVAALERALRIHDTVFRHLLVVQEAPSAYGEGLEAPNGEAVGEPPAPSVAGTAPADAPAAGEVPPAAAAALADRTAGAVAAGDDEDAEDELSAATDKEE
jgi:small subunit ribosomal protein S6